MERKEINFFQLGTGGNTRITKEVIEMNPSKSEHLQAGIRQPIVLSL